MSRTWIKDTFVKECVKRSGQNPWKERSMPKKRRNNSLSPLKHPDNRQTHIYHKMRERDRDNEE